MESVLKKFEKNAIDMSNIYGTSTHYTREMSVGTSGEVIYHGSEYVDIDEDGCAYTYLTPHNGGGKIDSSFIC